MNEQSNIESLHPLLQQALVSRSAVFNMDCMEFMKDVPDKFFNLAVVDPPYGIDIAEKLANGWVSKAGGTKFEAKDWDKYTPTQEYWDELFRVSKNQIVWGGNYFMSKIKRDSPCWIFWDKNNGDSLFADGEMAWTSFDSPVRLAKIHWCGSAAKHETGQKIITIGLLQVNGHVYAGARCRHDR